MHTFLGAARGTIYYPLFHLDIYTGLRRSELLGLRWKDVDLDMACLYVTQVLHRLKGGKNVFLEPKTAKSRRRVDLSPQAVLTLRKHREGVQAHRLWLGKPLIGDDLVFSHPDETPIKPDTVTHAFLERLGHSTIAITLDTYSHVTPGLQAAPALRFDEGLTRPTPTQAHADGV